MGYGNAGNYEIDVGSIHSAEGRSPTLGLRNQAISQEMQYDDLPIAESQLELSKAEVVKGEKEIIWVLTEDEFEDKKWSSKSNYLLL